jgi:hypothetical protein
MVRLAKREVMETKTFLEKLCGEDIKPVIKANKKISRFVSNSYVSTAYTARLEKRYSAAEIKMKAVASGLLLPVNNMPYIDLIIPVYTSPDLTELRGFLLVQIKNYADKMTETDMQNAINPMIVKGLPDLRSILHAGAKTKKKKDEADFLYVGSNVGLSTRDEPFICAYLFKAGGAFLTSLHFLQTKPS